MPYGINQPVDIEDWGDILRSSLEGAGLQVGMKLMGEGEDQWWRVATRPRGTQLEQLSLDIGVGPAAGEFGRTIQLRSQASDWHAIMGPEIHYSEETGPQIFSPLENLVRYQTSAHGAARHSPMFERTTAHEEFWKFATLGSKDYGLAGSIPRVGGPGASGRLAEDVAWWATIGYGSDVQDFQTARQNIYSQIQAPGGGQEGRLWRALGGHAMFSERQSDTGSSITRMKPAGIPLEGGQVLGIGVGAEDIIKRRSVTMGMGGTREQAFLYQQDEGGAWHEQEPGYITDPTQRGGYKYSNILFPGETEPRAQVVQPGTMIRSGGLFPGGLTQYDDPIAGSRIAYQSQSRVNLPGGYIPGYAEEGAEFTWGLDWKEGAPTSQITGAEIPAHSRVKIGQYTIPGKPGEDPITEDIWYKTGAAPVHFRGEPRLHFPGAFHKAGQFAGMGHSAVFATRQPKDVQLLNEGQRQAIIEAAGGAEVDFTSMQDPFITIPTAKVTGGSVKGIGGFKAAPFTPGGLEQIPQNLREVEVAGGFRIPVTGVTAELKASLPAFVGTFGTMTNVQQQRALQQVYGGQVGQGLAGYVQGLMEQTDAPAAAVPLMGLAQQAYNLQEGEGVMPREYGMQFWEQFRRGFYNLGEEQLAEYGEAQLGAIYGEWHMRTPKEMRELRSEAMSLYTGNRPREEITMAEALAARRQFRQNISVTRQESGNYLVGSLAESRMSTIAGGLAPEFMTDKPTKWGIDERSAVTAQYNEIARFLGIHTEMSPYQSGMRPPHVRGWDVLSDVMGYNIEGQRYREAYTRPSPTTGDPEYVGTEPPVAPNRIEMTEERSGELIRAMQNKATMQELGEITRAWGQGPLYQPALPPGQQYLPQPGTILGVAEAEYGEEGGEWINRIARMYEKALPEFALGSETGQAKFQASLQRAIQSSGGTTTKGRVSSYLPSGFGGRYEQATGIDPGYAIMSEDRMMTVMKNMAQQADIPWNKQTQAQIRSQLEEQMRGPGLGALGIRYPVLGQEAGSVAMKLVTPQIAQEMFGLSQEEASVTGHSLRVGASFYGSVVGDVDRDPITGAILARFGEEGNLEFPQANMIDAMVQRQLRTGGDALSLAMGERGGGQFNELQQAIQSLGSGRLRGIGQTGLTRVSGSELRGAGELAMGSKMGMGVSFNLRRLMTASAEAIGFPGTTVSRGHTAGARSYQEYLDAVANAEGGFSNVERMMQTLYVKSRKGVPVMGSMVGQDQWGTFGDYSDDPQTYAANLQRGMGNRIRQAMVGDIASGHMTPAAAALLLGQPGVADPRDIESALTDISSPGDISRVLQDVMHRPGYDVTASTIGTAMFTRLGGKIAQGTMRDPTGAELPLAPEIGKQGVPIGGQVWRFDELERTPQLAATAALYKQYRGKEGTLIPSEQEAIIRNFQRIEGMTGGLTPYSMQAVMSAYGSGGAESVQVAREIASQSYYTREGVLRLPQPGRAERASRQNIRSIRSPEGETYRRVGEGGTFTPTGNVGTPSGPTTPTPPAAPPGAPPGGGGGGPPSDPNDPAGVWGMYIQHLGATKLPSKIMQDYGRGVSAYTRMFGQGAGEEFEAQTARIQRFIQGAMGDDFGPNFFQSLADTGAGGTGMAMYQLRSVLGEAIQADPAGFRQLFGGRGAQIMKAGARGFQDIQKAAQAARAHGDIVGQIAPDITRQSGVGEWDITSTAEGQFGTGVEANLYGMLQELAREQGITSRTGAMATPDQATAISQTSKDFIDSMSEFTKKLEESKEAIGDETMSRKEHKELMDEFRMTQRKGIAMKQARLAPEIASLEALIGEREAAGAGEIELGELRSELGGMYETQQGLSRQDAQLLAAGRGRTGQEVLKSLTGGWNIMYMMRMAQLGMGQLGQGYGELEQYRAQTQVAGIGTFGAGVGGYAGPMQDYQRALLRGAGQFMSPYQTMQAGIAGTPLSDIGGAGLTGVGAMSLAGFVGTTLSGGTGAVAGLGGLLSSAALPIGLLAAGGALAATQAGYMREPEMAAMQVAAMPGFAQEPEDTTFLQKVGAGLSAFWKLGLPDLLAGRSGEPDSAMVMSQQYMRWMGQAQGREFGPGTGDFRELGQMTDQERINLARSLGFSEDFAETLPSEMAASLAMQFGGEETWGAGFEEGIERIGLAQMAGRDVGGLAGGEAAFLGRGVVSSQQLFERAQELSLMGSTEFNRYQAGFGLLQQTPGMQRQLAGMGTEALEQAIGRVAPIAGGAYQGMFLQRAGMYEQMAGMGMGQQTIDYAQYAGTEQWSAQDLTNWNIENMRINQAMGIQQGLMSRGVFGFGEQIAGMNVPTMQRLQSAISMRPTTLTQMAQQGVLDDRFALGDIDLEGNLTGLAWGTTSLQAGGTSGADMAAQFFGEDWQEHGGIRAAVEGVTTPTGARVGGERGLRWALTYAQRGYQSDQQALQRDRLGLQSWYMHNMWGIQDQQRALQHEQQLWSFGMQERRFEMEGEQFFERRGLQRREMLNRRQWQVQDRAYEDTVSSLQWQWQTEDYEENIRFMTGRQRRQAERQMERATTMRGLQMGQRDRTRGRQDEIFAMQEEQFEMQREHWEQNRELIEENMEKQREFYEEGKKLQDEMIQLQRQYWEANHALSLRAQELQEEYTATTEELQDAIRLINEEQQDRNAAIQKELELNPAGVIEEIIAAFLKLDEVVSQSSLVNIGGSGSRTFGSGHYGAFYAGDFAGGHIPRQGGGDVMPHASYLVGEQQPEVMRPGMIGSVATMADIRTAERMNRDRWGDTTLSPSPTGGHGSAAQQAINIYIGGKKIKEFIVDTISQELEVR